MGMFGGKTQPSPSSQPRPQAGGARRRSAAPRPKPAAEAQAPAAEVVWGQPGITVLFSGVEPVDQARLAAALAREFPGVASEVRSIFASSTDAILGSAPGVARDAAGIDGQLGFEARIGGVVITAMFMPMPAPGLDEMLQTSRCDREENAQVLPGHRSHLLCFTKVGPEQGIEATAHLLRLAVALEEQGAIGVIQTDAWQCFQVKRLRDHLEAKVLAQITSQLFPMVWCNAIPFHGEGGSWMTSKGFAVAGIPDVTMWVRNAQEMRQAGEFLPNLFLYLRKGAKLTHGETIQMEGSGNYRIGPVTEHHGFLCGRGETIALRPV